VSRIVRRVPFHQFEKSWPGSDFEKSWPGSDQLVINTRLWGAEENDGATEDVIEDAIEEAIGGVINDMIENAIEDVIEEETKDIMEDEEDIVEEEVASGRGEVGKENSEEGEEEKEDDGIPVIESLGIKEVHEHKWYIVQCIAGTEMSTLQKILKVVPKTPGATEDITKIVVPTRKSGTSVGKTVKLTNAVIYPAYIFLYMKLTNRAYEAVGGTPGVGSWVGDSKGFEMIRARNKAGELVYKRKKVFSRGLTVPRPLTPEEINGFKLLGRKGKKASEANRKAAEFAIGTMIKCTSGNWEGDVGAVRLVRDGKVVVRFWAYGNQADIYLSPDQIRNLTPHEVAAGYEEPTPQSQEDVNTVLGIEPRKKLDSRGRESGIDFYAGRGSTRNRRQDRVARGEYGNDRRGKEALERRNWEKYKENNPGNVGQGSTRGGDRAGDGIREFTQEDPTADADAHWGLKSAAGGEGGTDHDWSSFAEKSATKKEKKNGGNDDDFFEDLMNELSKSMGGGVETFNAGNDDKRNNAPRQLRLQTSDDDFFEEIMGQLSGDFGYAAGDRAPTANGLDETKSDSDDFFDELMDCLDGPATSSKGKRGSPASAQNSSSAGEIFDDLMGELTADLEAPLPATGKETRAEMLVGNDDAFFDSLMGDLEATMGMDEVVKTKKSMIESPKSPLRSSSAPTSSSEELSKFTVPKLKEKLRERGLPVSGRKQELIDRLLN